MFVHRKLAVGLVFFLCAVSFGQKTQAQKVAVWPPIYLKDATRSENQTAIKAVEEAVKSSFDKAGVNILPSADVQAAINRAEIPRDKDSDALASPESMEQIGRACGADIVLTYRCRWHVKTVFQITGLHTKSECTVSLEIFSVPEDKVIYNPDPVKADNQQAPNGLLIAASLLVWGPTAFVSGGPETGPMARAGQVSMAIALNDWVKARTEGK